MNIIELHAITKKFNGLTAVNNLSLNVPQGSIYGFIGPNGSGKTTTIRMIMNILYPDSGQILLFGSEHSGARLENVGYLPEERGLYKKMKVRDLLRFHGELKNGKNLGHEIDYWLKKMDLTDWGDRRAETLSKGMSQKLQLIATIIDRPALIILDEPFSGLDPVNAEVIRTAVLELQKNGATVIFSTHDMNMAEIMCDYIFMIYKGNKVLDGTLESIKDNYGADTLRIHTEKGMAALQSVPGIELINDFGQMQEIRMEAGADSQKILSEILSRTKVSRFEVTRPSLNDIFIRIARPEKTEEEHA
jgi:ABC-2 type transport system ATP-binding protein